MNSTCPSVLTSAAFCKLIAVNQPMDPATPVKPIKRQALKLFLIKLLKVSKNPSKKKYQLYLKKLTMDHISYEIDYH